MSATTEDPKEEEESPKKELTHNDGSLPLPTLPLSVWVRICSYNVSTTTDVASLRWLCSLEPIVSLLPSLAPSMGHCIACPNKNWSVSSFAEELVTADEDVYEWFQVCVGDSYEADPVEFVKLLDESNNENCPVTRVQFIGRPSESKKEIRAKMKKSASDNGEASYEKLKDICTELLSVDNMDHLERLYREAERLDLLHALNPGESTLKELSDQDPLETLRVYPVMLTIQDLDRTKKEVAEELGLLEDAKDHHESSTLGKSNDTNLELQQAINNDSVRPLPSNDSFFEVSSFPFQEEDVSQGMVPLQSGCKFRAVEIEGSLIVLMNLVVNTEYIWDEFYDYNYDDSVTKSSLVYSSLWDKHQTKSLVEGVAIVDGAIGPEFQSQLQQQVNALAAKQEAEGTVDYHPKSNNIVRDLVHPAIYSYVKDVSPLRATTKDMHPCVLPNLGDDKLDENESDDEGDDDDGNNTKKDFWGRKYERSTYQWLPTYFDISPQGKCQIQDYINNLTPREHHTDLYHSLSRLFEQALPYMESVYSYVHAVRKQLRGENDHVDYCTDSLAPLDMKHISLRGQSLQVITKIVDYELSPGQSHEGVWHVEGMSHEEIVLTCLYILDRDVAIEGGDIMYKRAFLKDEAEHVFSSVPQDRSDALDDVVAQGLVPLGTVETRRGRLIVFPNSHVHKVGKMINTAGATGNDGVVKRRIVVFFLVNPRRRIVSTREVAPQQKHSGGTMAHKDALQHRLDLMKERKFYKQDWNVREIELCEH